MARGQQQQQRGGLPSLLQAPAFQGQGERLNGAIGLPDHQLGKRRIGAYSSTDTALGQLRLQQRLEPITGQGSGE
jgi:hypothetical protein